MNFDINKLMQDFQKMPDIMNKVQDKLSDIRVKGSSGAGMVEVLLNGKGEAISVEIQDEAYDSGKEFLQDLLLAAINDAANKREQAKMEALKSIGGLEGVLGNL